MNPKDILLDVYLCDFDMSGISVRMKQLGIEERKKSWCQLFSLSSYNDYLAYTSGQGPYGSYFLKMTSYVRRSHLFEKIAIVYFFPMYQFARFYSFCLDYWSWLCRLWKRDK